MWVHAGAKLYRYRLSNCIDVLMTIGVTVTLLGHLRNRPFCTLCEASDDVRKPCASAPHDGASLTSICPRSAFVPFPRVPRCQAVRLPPTSTSSHGWRDKSLLGVMCNIIEKRRASPQRRLQHLLWNAFISLPRKIPIEGAIKGALRSGLVAMRAPIRPQQEFEAGLEGTSDRCRDTAPKRVRAVTKPLHW
jgi:hypothetical protein